MSHVQIARVDAIPLLFAWMQTMDVAGQIDAHWTPHREWEGLSYGQLTVLFLIFLIHEQDHRLSALEPWVQTHHATLTAVTGWSIRREDVTDDRLGRLLGVLGRDPDQMTVLQQALGRHLVRAYALPTTERMLRAFTNLHLHLQRVGDQWVGTVVETLNPVQQRILQVLKLSPTLYTFSTTLPVESPAQSGYFQKWRHGSNTSER